MKKLFVTIVLGAIIVSLLSSCASERTLEQRRYNKAWQAFSQRRYAESLKYIVKGAEKARDPRAQYALGYMYYYGLGIPKDSQAAQFWIGRAAQQGFFPALAAQQQFQQAQYAPPPMERVGNVMFSPIPLDVTSPTPAKPAIKAIKPPPLPTTAAKTSKKTKTIEKTMQISPANIKKIALFQEKSAATLPSSAAHHLMTISSQYYTIQLLSVRNPHRLTQFIHAYQLQGKAFIYQTNVHQTPWYVLVYGIYSTKAAATEAFSKLPVTLQQFQPWVKSIARVHSELV